jgi:hypothetical protein
MGMTQEVFGLLVDKTRQTVYNWENGNPPEDKLLVLGLKELGKRYGFHGFEEHGQG